MTPEVQQFAWFVFVTVISATCGGLGVWFWISGKLLEARFERDRMKMALNTANRQREMLLRASGGGV